jgi:hypothetical protein
VIFNWWQALLEVAEIQGAEFYKTALKHFG